MDAGPQGESMRVNVWGAAGAMALVVSAPLHAASIMHVSAIPLQTTNWTNSVTVPKFDSSLGTLDKITFKLTGHVEGTARFESRDAAPSTVHMELSSRIRLRRPDLTDLVISLPVASTTDAASPWDGVDDFGGTSGRSYSGLAADDLEQAVLMSPFSPADTANFIGGPADTITLPVDARGTSMGSGAGNLLLLFNTSASAGVMVMYEYTVPEPASAGLFLAAGALLLSRRRF
jgi:hypothetical protein